MHSTAINCTLNNTSDRSTFEAVHLLLFKAFAVNVNIQDMKAVL